ncbi:hypothetical protein [Maribacter sp. 2307ULW6-5]|uniref:hypothetical protein n=1 Tax=Maribacter sp. 2307ULW6-5 TaxID=3386275 RepID=UPI0039BD5311
MKLSSHLFFVFFLVFLAFSLPSSAQKQGAVLGDAPTWVVERKSGLGAYTSTIDFKDERKQLLMAGQSYGTNYGIYASIKMGKSSLGARYRTLERISFEVVNYKPIYFIGIDSVVVGSGPSKDGLVFKIYTRAMSQQTTLVLDRQALAHIHFEKGSYLHSQRQLNPMFPRLGKDGRAVFLEDGRVACDPDNGKAFDFEFFYKDGRHVVRKQDYDREGERAQGDGYKGEIALSLPGRRCRHSFNKVVF